jgi:hypothetical protein
MKNMDEKKKPNEMIKSFRYSFFFYFYMIMMAILIKISDNENRDKLRKKDCYYD